MIVLVVTKDDFMEGLEQMEKITIGTVFGITGLLVIGGLLIGAAVTLPMQKIAMKMRMISELDFEAIQTIRYKTYGLYELELMHGSFEKMMGGLMSISKYMPQVDICALG